MVKNFFIAMSYATTLRQKRKAAKMSQERLAQIVTARGHRITGAYVSMIEREYDKTASGKPTRINRDFVVRAAEALEWNVNEALIEADYAPLDMTQDSLVSIFNQLTPEKRKIIESVLFALMPPVVVNVESIGEINEPQKARKKA